MTRKADFILGCLLGLFVAIYFYGMKIIDPYNIQWLLKGGDSYQHFIGWAFFKNDIWRWPLGFNPNFGSEIGGSIVFTDSIPLLAILFKLILKDFSEPFQFFGIAVMINYMLTGGVLVLLLKKFINNLPVCLMVSLLLVSSTVMSTRGIGAHGHESLTAHWTFLYAMHLLLAQEGKAFPSVKWAGLLVVTSLIHFYLLVICIPFYAAAHIYRFYLINDKSEIKKEITKKIYGIILTIIILLGVMYIAGYFVMPVGNASTRGYGSYPASLLTFINPASAAWFLNTGVISSLSRIFQGFPSAITGQYEGQAYLGLGLIMLIGVSSFSLLKRKVSLVWAVPVAIVCFLLSLVAVSHHISLYDQQFIISMNPILSRIFGVVRSSGRLIWPMFYLMVIIAAVILARNFSVVNQYILLLLVILLQFFDLSLWHDSLRKRNNDYSSVYIDNLINNKDFSRMIAGSKKIVLLPADYLDDFQIYAWEAVRAGISINSGYYARLPSSDYFKKINEAHLNEVRTCNLIPHVLYIIREVDVEVCQARDIIYAKSHNALWMIKGENN
ncbi:DUF6311 domain-containing protein [Iodobacter ciconiae]|uniref:Glycosyltransferase RgtA/B/C/D-like domain-containing protein n=1 Tax=Iodobacter ciconiae TaxID=2496266 RepID=A0A3S8ZWD7_9NEIS|nr:DUF6311 domain-containing protein [Iodobacter ciconiae]AZN37820.1 hypothetical protein EJO50_15920 [Iodobacter ciconiae]